ncbi:hemolysin family protein [uncultured Varibaculum sp.]|uniref:hemolysin family protein n=1 Tax=uncultured Varibaculum sp. TaxID=413896 RepID=UPI002595CB71|nr:hemolysin family protein [uncultured Varibaculum sp.]
MFSQIPAGRLLALAIVLVAVDAAWTAALGAFQTLSHARAQDLVEEGRHRAPLVRALVADRAHTVAICQSWRLFAQVLAATCMTLAMVGFGLVWWVALLVSLLVLGALLLIFATFAGMRIGRYRPEATALWLSKMVSFGLKISVLYRPIEWIANRIAPLSPVDEAASRAEIAEDFREMVDEMAEEENLAFEDEDREIVRSALELGTTLVREIIVPRTDMVAVDTTTLAREAFEIFIQSGFSRIPVLGDDADDVRGMLYLKDVVSRCFSRPELMDHPVPEMMREAFFVPEVMLADDLMRQMQADAPHIAVVVDEWGGTVGLVTIEDILEELVGEVTDEHDRAEQEPEQLSDNTWVIPARLGLDDLATLVDLEIDDDEVDTAGGLLAKALGKVPLLGSHACVMGLELTVKTVAGRRRQMDTLLVKRLEIETDEE